MRAVEARRGYMRRSLAPAAEGVSRATGQAYTDVCKVMGIDSSNRAKQSTREGYETAAKAAMRAASYAAWRPETRASVVGGAAADDLGEPIRLAPRDRALPVLAARPPRPEVTAPIAETRAETGGWLSEEDKVHLQYIHAANSGRGFPAPRGA